MFENIENLKLISSYQGTTRDYIEVENKKYNSFVFRTAGTGIYTVGTKKHTIYEGQMAFLPKGASYEFKRISENKCEYMNIVFEGNVDSTDIKIYSMDNFTNKIYIINHFPSLWKFGSQSDKYKCYSLFYDLLSYVAAIENAEYANKTKVKIIEPAIEYLKNHIFDPGLKIDALHEMCGISDTYFRKIFMSNFRFSPKEYIIATRISHAMEIIENGSFSNVADLALSVGYTDPLYFSRAFKKKFGVSPSMTK